jgi:hypothetical protein
VNPMLRSLIVILALGCCLGRPAQAQDRCRMDDPLGEAAFLVSRNDTSTFLDSALVRLVDTELHEIRERYPQLRTIHGWYDGATRFTFAPFLTEGDDSLRFVKALREAISRGDTVGACVVLRTTGVAQVDSVAARLEVESIRAAPLAGNLASLLRSPAYMARVVMTFRRPLRAGTVRGDFGAVGFMEDPLRYITCWCEPEQSVTWTHTRANDEFLFHWRSHSGSQQRDTVVRVDRRGEARLISEQETRE